MESFSIDTLVFNAKSAVENFVDITISKNLAQMACEAELDDAKFKYSARLMWWNYCGETQTAIPFREFWNNELSYPRTIK